MVEIRFVRLQKVPNRGEQGAEFQGAEHDSLSLEPLDGRYNPSRAEVRTVEPGDMSRLRVTMQEQHMN